MVVWVVLGLTRVNLGWFGLDSVAGDPRRRRAVVAHADHSAPEGSRSATRYASGGAIAAAPEPPLVAPTTTRHQAERHTQQQCSSWLFYIDTGVKTRAAQR